MRHWLKSVEGRERLILSAAVALAIGAAGGWQLHAMSANAQEDAVAVAKAEVDRFYRALTPGGPPLADVLGDAFQLMRTDGSRYDRAEYLARPPTLSEYALDKFEATRSGDILTATFYAGLTGTVEGVNRDSVSDPRMAVFSRVDGAWKLQAIANLGQGAARDLGEEAEEAVTTWVNAVADGDFEAVRALLAPEFQVVRSDGSAYEAADYLARGLPKIDAVLNVENLAATGYGDIMIVRYDLELKASIESQRVEGEAPRLTVFRRSGDGWLVVAHANFAPSNR